MYSCSSLLLRAGETRLLPWLPAVSDVVLQTILIAEIILPCHFLPDRHPFRNIRLAEGVLNEFFRFSDPIFFIGRGTGADEEVENGIEKEGEDNEQEKTQHGQSPLKRLFPDS
jgi:hypothetical protein